MPPSAYFVGQGPVVPANSERALPITTTNVEQVDLELLRPSTPQKLLRDYYLPSRLSGYTLDRLRREFESVFIERYTVNGYQQNQSVASRLALSADLEPGWYIAVMKPAGSFSNSELQIRYVLITDLGVQARLYPDSLAVIVSSLSDGLAVKTGRVRVYDKDELVAEEKLDEQGTATLPVNVGRQHSIVVDSGQQTTLLPLQEIPLDLSEFTVGGANYQSQQAYIYSNRDLLRPGDALPLNILLRDADGRLLPEQPVHLTLRRPDNQVAHTEELTALAAGFYSTELDIVDSAPVGRWQAEVRTDPTGQPLNRFSFQVEEFIPERMDLILTSQRETILAHEELELSLSGRYLFGSPADGNRVTSRVSYQPIRHLSGPYQQFHLGQEFSLYPSYLRLDDIELDSKGEGTIMIPAPEEALLSPVRGSVSVDLQESGGPSVQRQASFTVVADAPMPAIRPQTGSFRYKQPGEFDIALLSPDGQELRSAELEVVLERNRGPYYWSYEEGAGWQRHHQPEWESVEERKVVVSDDIAQQTFGLNWGNYRLTVTEPESGAVTQFSFYAGWSESTSQIAAKPDHLDISFDSSAYANGSTVEATFNAPISGNLLVSVEGSELLWSERIQVEKGTNLVSIPVSEQWLRHDLYVTGLLTGNGKSAIPLRYLGIEHLKLDRSERTLEVNAELPEKLEPMTTVRIPVQIEPGQEGRYWATMSIVDKGILNISRYRAQNPAQFMFGRKRYSTDIVDLYSRLYQNRPDPFATPRFGSDAATSDELLETPDLVDVKTVILMSELVEFDSEGKAYFEFDIPDYNGEVEVVVTAFGEQEFGHVARDLVVAAPLVAELAVPRFIVPGDRSAVTIDLHNLSGSEQTLHVELDTGASIALIDEQPGEVVLADGDFRSILMRFNVEQQHLLNQTEFTLRATGDELGVERSWRVPIRPAVPRETLHQKAVLPSGGELKLTVGDWGDLTPLLGGGTVRFSHTPQLNIDHHLQSLQIYPYLCAEQTTSKAMPYVFDSISVQELQSALIDEEAQKTQLKNAVDHLASMQRSTGGFSMWAGNSWSEAGDENPWASVYVTDFLLLTQQRYPGLVPETMLANAKKRVQAYVKQNSTLHRLIPSKEQRQVIGAYAAYVMAREGEINWGDIRSFEQRYAPSVFRTQWPSRLSYVQLNAAFAMAGDPERVEAMLRRLSSTRRVNGYIGDYGSELRDDALVYAILDQLERRGLIDSDRVAETKVKLFNQTLARTNQKRWLSTQENNALVLAGGIAADLNRAPLTIEVNGESQTHDGAGSVVAKPGLVLSNTTDKPVYIESFLQGYSKNTQMAQSSIDFQHVKRTLFTEEGALYQGSKPILPGDRIVALIELSLEEEVPDGMLVDLIPAGFVLENPALGGGVNPEAFVVQGDDAASEPTKLADLVNGKPLYSEFRDDRFVVADHFASEGSGVAYSYTLRAEVPGEYQLPPLFIEDMYSPERRIIQPGSIETLVIGDTVD
ncbi:alpha-2-macroglobulin family protein [Vibrio sp. WXL210]|uniref:alpha-2-macroglobulin family protein n=1 Tax=Vibrio sp. WXL210 TaxID=3450709 RepID=UPI003EC858BE